MLQAIKKWLRLRREHKERRHCEDSDFELPVKGAMHNHLVSTRLVRIQAARSAKALKQLSEVLALRARAIDSISAAEDALVELDKDRRDDK